VIRLILTCILWLVAAPALAEASAKFEGRCLEHLQWQGDYLLQRFPHLGIAYRWNGDEKYFFLVEPVQSGKACGTAAGHVIVAALELPPEPEGAWHAVNFTCSNSKDVEIGDTVVGLFQGNGTGPSLAAWKIDPKKKRFERVESVQCKSFS
jgi:hypothetical protein